MKDVAKRRNEKLRVLQLDHETVRQRLGQLFKFREQHERLLSVFAAVLSSPSAASHGNGSRSATTVSAVTVQHTTDSHSSNLAEQLQVRQTCFHAAVVLLTSFLAGLLKSTCFFPGSLGCVLFGTSLSERLLRRQ